MAGIDHPWAAVLPHVEKPARYLGGEFNSVIKDWTDEAIACRFVLAFPDLYDIGMSHLGTKILYKLINQCPDLLMERSFCPWIDMEEQLRGAGLPLISLESHRPLCDFDVLGFSLQYEMTYSNVLTMLDLGGVPLRTSEREDRDPIVIAGGPCATHPESIAPFIDAFLIGDAEEALPDLLRLIGKLKQAETPRQEILHQLAKVPGIYVPSLYTTRLVEETGLEVVDKPLQQDIPARVTRCLVEDLSQFPFPDDSPIALNEAIFDRLSIEISRGCTEGCRFCQAGMIYRPVRERSPEDIIQTLESALDKGGFDEASLTSLSTADYSCISPLIREVMKKLRPKRVGLGISSLRAYGLDEGLLDEIATVKATGLTFAPEAGTQRMRDVINKNISEEDIRRTCHRVFARGWRKMKLYFILGLPTETEEDLEGIIEMGRKAYRIGREFHRNVTVTVSVSSHVPKPHTPFQWCAMDSMETIAEKQEYLWQRARRAGFRLRKHDMRVSHLEGIIGRGDRRVADLLELAWRKGARFDSWDERLDWESWQEALAEWESATGIDRQIFLKTLPLDQPLPWDHIDVGLEEGFLAGEYRRALNNRLSPPCGKPKGEQVHHTNLADANADERKLVCYHCGIACDLSAMRQERKDFLQQLGASEPWQGGNPGWREAAMERVSRGEAPHAFDQGKPIRLRIRMERQGIGRMFSQLDLVRVLPQVLRRAGLNLYYSQGYNPHPVMSFAPAIPFMAGSLADLVDVQLAMPVLPQDLDERLLHASSPGMVISQAEELPDDAAPLSKTVDSMDWLIQLPDTAMGLDAEQEPALLPELVKAYEKSINARIADQTPVKVLRKNRVRELDLSEQLAFARVIQIGAEGPSGDLETGQPGLLYRQKIVAGAGIKPEELVHALFGNELSAVAILRLACLCDGQDVMQERQVACLS